MNKCPNCGKTAVSPTDKLFRTNRLECQHCGTKLQLPSYTNSIVIAAVLLSWLAFFILNLEPTAQLLFGLGIVALVGVGLILLPLQVKR